MGGDSENIQTGGKDIYGQSLSKPIISTRTPNLNINLLLSCFNLLYRKCGSSANLPNFTHKTADHH